MQNLKYVKIPIDTKTIKENWIMGFTARQVKSFFIGGLCGIVPFYLVKEFVGIIPAVITLCVCAFPAIFCGMFDKNGIHFEKYFLTCFNFFTKPKRKLFKSHNAAEYIELEIEKKRLERKLRNG